MKITETQSMDLVRLCCRALDEKKAGDLRVLDVRGLSSITEFLVIATATSEPHVRALRVELEKALDGSKSHIVGIETARESGWAVMDAFDVMIHIFAPEMRARYGLEKLWRDASEVPLKEVLAEKKIPSKRTVKAKKKAPAKKPKRKAG
jgi:ribosome-associated protein